MTNKTTDLIYMILEDLQKGEKPVPGDYEGVTPDEYNAAVDLIASNRFADNVVVVRGGIGGGIAFANLHNASINLNGVNYLERNTN